MNVAAMLRRAGSMTLLVYACHAGSSALLAWPLGARLAAVLARSPRPGPRQAAALAEVIVQTAPSLLPWALASAASYALLAPLLALAWLRTMAGARGALASVRGALDGYLPALWLRGCALLAASVPLGLAVLALRYGLALLPASELAETSLVAVACCAALLGLLAVATVHDLGCAAVAMGSPEALAALLFGLRRLSFALLVRHGLIALGIGLTMLLAEAAARVLSSTPVAGVVLCVQQALVLVATVLRGAWLALALQRTGRGLLNS